MENLLIIAISVTALAVVIQAGVLVALYVSVKKSSDRMESIAGDLQRRALPVLESAGEILADARPKLASITENLEAASSSLRTQAEHVQGALTDIVDRTRLHVIRADEMVTRTMDRFEQTTEVLQHSVISPVRQLAGVVSGLTVGLNAFFRRRQHHSADHETEDEELFI